MTRLRAHFCCTLPRFSLRLDEHWEGSTLGIFGPSGSGKSTFIEHLVGFRRDGEGTLVLNDQVLFDSSRRLWLPPEKRHIGFVPQAPLLFPHWTAERNILVGGMAKSLPQKHRQRLDELVELLDLSDLLAQPVVQLSGGEQRRLALARAMMTNPSLLVLDEPLANLDAERRRRVTAHLAGLRDELGIPLVLVSHDASDLLALTAEVWRFAGGQVEERGPTWSVLSRQQQLRDPVHAPRNALPGVVVTRHGTYVQVQLDSGILVHGVTQRAWPGDRAVVSVDPAELLVARTRPQGLSARNLWPARILECHGPEGGTGAEWLLLCQIAGAMPPLWVLVTENAGTELDLRAGEPIYVIAKASACPTEPMRASSKH